MELGSIFSVLFFMLNLYANLLAAKDLFKIEFKWSQIEFDFPSEQERTESINNGTFKEGKVQPIDVQVYYPTANEPNKIVYITCPRVDDGIPATLGIVTNKSKKGNPIITPYPNWEWQTNPEMCKKHRIVSVYRVFIDECHRLWILDNGKIGDNQVCPPQILAFNLITNSLLRQYEIPFDQHRNTSLYVTPVVETNHKCKDTFVYSADPIGPSLLVYNFKSNKSWRIFDDTFKPDPSYEKFNIDGETFMVTDGILGLALSPPSEKNQRKLYYHAMSSGTENWVYTKYLKNNALFYKTSTAPHIFNKFRRKRNSQSAAEAMDNNGNMYFGLLHSIEIASWNIYKPKGYKDFCIVGDDKKIMQFPSGMKVIGTKNGEEILWVFATAYQKYASNTLFSNQTNFHILSAKVKELQQYCQSS